MKFRDIFDLKHIIFAIVIVAIMLGFAMMQSNNSVKTTFEEDYITVRSSRFSMKISYADIESLELAELGDPGEKANEDAQDDDIVRYGSWTNETWGDYVACLDLDTSKCIVAHIADGRTLVFSRKNDKTTTELYETLLTYLPNE